MSDIRVFGEAMSSKRLLDSQAKQRSEMIPLTQIVPPGGALGKVSVGTMGAFLLLYITGHFETLGSVVGGGGPAATIDDGVCDLRGQLRCSSGTVLLFSDFIPLDLWVSPGRRLSATATNLYGAVTVNGTVYNQAMPVSPLFYPTEFQFLFPTNSDIQVDLRNDGNVAEQVDLSFHGIRIFRQPGD
jgi:hypothetical protein